MTALLKVRNLKVGFRQDGQRVAAVKGVSFDVERGETVALVGESGSGKSVTALSTVSLLGGSAEVEGSVTYDGREMVHADDKTLRQIRGNDISFIFQEPMTSLNPIMTIGAQIGEALQIHRRLPAASRRAEIKRLLGLVGLPSEDAQLDRYPFQLSGGQRQRVMIAIALACEPALLIADEPTTALDVTIQAQILDLIAEMRQRFGMACVMVTHDLGVVAETCDRAIVMYAGRVAEEGPVDELFGAPIHRYTEALVGTIPAANPPGARLPAIPGAVPPPGDRPAGCAFAGRCEHALDVCASRPPPEVRRGAHVGYCWNPAS
ncbi:ABC transporter ATP-binding protein [Roseitalea porphyridii]|uniref:ABC transporter ATP-binding protein n=1 Tax=Roseitalea porphyridii TaxID=1852022 RepID=UPI0032EB5BDE